MSIRWAVWLPWLPWVLFYFTTPVFLATPHHGPLRPEGHVDLRGGLRDERSIKSHHIYVPDGLRPPFIALYYPHYRHIFVYPFFISIGVQFLPWMRGGSAVSSSTATYCGMLLWSREYRSSKTMHIPSIDQLPRWARGF